MCGISGLIDFKNSSTKEILEKMTDILHHRGPDDSGYYFEQLNSCQIGLGHRRLSILDLSPLGHQPMMYNNFIITYNGEIYNFQEIKADLERCGDRFLSNSDTEVILHAFEKWGLEAIHKFNGMFVFAIYDKKDEKVYIYRDRAGVKPLYWYWKRGAFLFASELKSFHQHPSFEKEIDLDSLGLYLQYGYILQPHTIFKNTYKLKAGHYLEINLKNSEIKESKYWDVIDFYNKPQKNVKEEEALENIEELLKSAFNYRMVSDVPVGVFLSGGYDSSIVTAILQHQRKDKIKTFTIGFHEKGYDEAPFAKKVAQYLGTEHTEYYCTQKDALDIIPKLPEIYDEPFGDSSAIPTTLVSQLARKHVTVSLSADGGDEIFAGYPKHGNILKAYRILEHTPNLIKNLVKNSMNFINLNKIPYLKNIKNLKFRYDKINNIIDSKSIIDCLKLTNQHFSNKEISTLFINKLSSIKIEFDKSLVDSDYLNQILALDYKTYMIDDILTKVDRATMSVSLEGREPLLDYRIIEYVAGLSGDLKYKNGIKKYLLKTITHKYLPKELMDRKKMGFSAPIFDWFKMELKEYFLDYLSENRLKKEGIFNIKNVINLRDLYLNGSNENIQRLWFILMFEMWYERWM